MGLSQLLEAQIQHLPIFQSLDSFSNLTPFAETSQIRHLVSHRMDQDFSYM
jgi:hypothetical protein